ncbi:MAG: tetratricopeptide repeat protein [Alphaproteobacteria bacterium]|nr:tetratricopeptide repeat protein [Alphaproteobacteria bacterium]
MIRSALVGSLVLLAACGGSHRQVQDAPRWQTEKQSVRMEIVKTLLDSGESVRALELIRMMRVDGVDDPQLDMLQGVALRQQGLSDEAERLLLKAQTRDQRNPAVYRELCVLYADDERTAEAIDACHRATELNAADAKAWNNYGFLLLTAGEDPKAAREALQKAVEIDATVARYRNNLAYAQALSGDHRAALKTFMTTGTPADAHYNVGTAFERNGDDATALTYYKRALKMDAEHLYADEAVKRLASKTTEEN